MRRIVVATAPVLLLVVVALALVLRWGPTRQDGPVLGPAGLVVVTPTGAPNPTAGTTAGASETDGSSELEPSESKGPSEVDVVTPPPASELETHADKGSGPAGGSTSHVG